MILGTVVPPAVQNAFSLVYWLKLPSEIYSTYAFATRLGRAGRTLPKVHMIAKNRITQYMGSASAYRARPSLHQQRRAEVDR